MENINEILESVKALSADEKLAVLNGVIALLWGDNTKERALKSTNEPKQATVTELSSFRPAIKPIDLTTYRESKS